MRSRLLPHRAVLHARLMAAGALVIIAALAWVLFGPSQGWKNMLAGEPTRLGPGALASNEPNHAAMAVQAQAYEEELAALAAEQQSLSSAWKGATADLMSLEAWKTGVLRRLRDLDVKARVLQRQVESASEVSAHQQRAMYNRVRTTTTQVRMLVETTTGLDLREVTPMLGPLPARAPADAIR